MRSQCVPGSQRKESLGTRLLHCLILSTQMIRCIDIVKCFDCFRVVPFVANTTDRHSSATERFNCTCKEPFTDGDGFTCSGMYSYRFFWLHSLASVTFNLTEPSDIKQPPKRKNDTQTDQPVNATTSAQPETTITVEPGTGTMELGSGTTIHDPEATTVVQEQETTTLEPEPKTTTATDTIPTASAPLTLAVETTTTELDTTSSISSTMDRPSSASIASSFPEMTVSDSLSISELSGLVIGVLFAAGSLFFGCGALLGYIYILRMLLSNRRGGKSPPLHFNISLSTNAQSHKL